ncbi:MAG TPA: spore cortex biosynthesis protein YabQ [Ruminiclostridium sp.]|nr:spore cortex biosynthesis protein YabQ [Ruminiclostridium sp.]
MILIVEQVYIFLYAVLTGGALAFLYDILRIKRRAIKTSVIVVNIEDIIYWLLAAVIVFLTVYSSNDGQMRGFIFIGNILGVILYLSLLSKIVIASSMMVINLIKRIILFIWKIISYPFRIIFKILFIPLRLIGRCFGKFIRKAFGGTGKVMHNAKGVTAAGFRKAAAWGKQIRKVRKKT